MGREEAYTQPWRVFIFYCDKKNFYQFHTAAKRRIHCLLFHTVHHWFQAFLTVLSYFKHTDQFLPLWEGEEFDNYAECRWAPLCGHCLTMCKMPWPGICSALQSSLPSAGSLEQQINRKKIGTDPRLLVGPLTPRPSNQELGTQNLFAIHHLRRQFDWHLLVDFKRS